MEWLTCAQVGFVSILVLIILERHSRKGGRRDYACAGRAKKGEGSPRGAAICTVEKKKKTVGEKKAVEIPCGTC